MINHARTLLMNLDGSSGFLSIPGDEILDPDFKSRKLGNSSQAIRRVLFGTSPDRYLLNYRCRQLLGLIHGTELEEFTSDLDSRVTYNFQDNGLFPKSVFEPTITNVGSHSYDIDIQGEREAPDSHGMMHKVWDIVMGSSVVTVSLQGTSHSEIVSLSGSPAPITLITSPLGALINTSAPSSTQWTIDSIARPQYELGALLNLLDKVGENYVADLFEVATPAGSTEPIKSLYSIWKSHKELAYRLGAITIALILQDNKATTA